MDHGTTTINRFSIVLLAVVDAHYKFLYIGMGCNEMVPDGVFRENALCNALKNNFLNVPPPESLMTWLYSPMPYSLVADDAFPLNDYIQKPFSLSLKMN